MAKVTTKASPRRGDVGAEAPTRTIEGPTFTRKNYLLLAGALGVIVAGFVILAQGDTTIAPVLLVVGYLILVPMALLKR